jgi:thioredoxin reductase
VRVSRTELHDAVIIGGGPAGLAAALWLGRYRRSVVVYDVGDPRNEPAWAVHGYPGVPDPTPSELRRRLFEQAQGAGADLRTGEVVDVQGDKGDFLLTTATDDQVRARRIILAYGLLDYLPQIDGIEALYGTSVFHCADCDGPSVADSRIGVIGWDGYGANLALYLRHWSDSVILLYNGQTPDLDDDATRVLRENDIHILHRTVSKLAGHGGNLTQAEFDDGSTVRLDALFFHLGSEPRCALASQLRCALDDDGYVTVDRGQETSCAGVYAAGDITGHPHLASIAAAEGVRAGLTIHRSLLPDSRRI